MELEQNANRIWRTETSEVAGETQGHVTVLGTLCSTTIMILKGFFLFIMLYIILRYCNNVQCFCLVITTLETSQKSSHRTCQYKRTTYF